MDKSIALKRNIHDVVDQVHDNSVLEAVYLLLEREARHQNDILSPLYVPSANELADIEAGYKESENGETVPHEIVMEEMKKKYSL